MTEVAAVPEGRVWKCSGCGLLQTWRSSWSWYGSYAQLEYFGADHIGVACSEKCRPAARRRSERLGEPRIIGGKYAPPKHGRRKASA